MKLSTSFIPPSRQPRLMIIAVTIAVMGVAVFLSAITACSPVTGSAQNIRIEATAPAVIEKTLSPIELITQAAIEKLPSTKDNVSAMAMIAAGKLEYQIQGQNSVSAEANEEVPLGTDVKIWNNDEIAKIELEDGSVIILDPFTILDLINVEQNTTVPIIRVILHRGSVLVTSENLWIITGDYEFRIRINRSIAGVSYDPLQTTIVVNCLGQEGSCSFYTATEWNELAPGQQLDYEGGVRGEVRRADFEGWQLLFKEISPTPTMTPPPNFTQIPTFTPSATVTPYKIPTAEATPNSEPGNRDTGPENGGGDGGHGG